MLAHRAGAETRVLCFTDGQAAHFRGDAKDNEALGRTRREEMDAACAVLGVTHHEVLHFPDGALAQESFRKMVWVVVERIWLWRPHVVLTFGADGGVNLHRDHTMVSVVTTAAFHWAGRPEMFSHPAEQDPSTAEPAGWTPQKLYHSSTPFISVRGRPELAGSPTVPWSLTLELGDLAERKMEAFLKHHSQRGVLERVGEQVKQAMRVERYLLAANRGQIAVISDTAMFAGIVEDGSQ